VRPARDVVVVGAGPAGALTALLARRAGRDVLLVDRARFPRDKVCGGCLNPRALATLRACGLGDLPRALGAVPLRAMELRSGTRSAVLPLPGGAAVSRRAFDAALVEAARHEGVEVREGTRAEVGLPEDGARVVLLDRLERVDARVVVLAGGLACDLPPDLRVVVSRRARIGVGALTNGPGPSTGTIAMTVTRSGYAGVVRVENGLLDVAAALDARAVRRAGGLGEAMAGLGVGPADWRATPALTRRVARVAAERLFVVGDAAGYVEPFTGEGLAWALAGARALAPIASAPWTAGAERKWTRGYRACVARRQRICRTVARGLRVPALVALATALLGRAPVLARPWVEALA